MFQSSEAPEFRGTVEFWERYTYPAPTPGLSREWRTSPPIVPPLRAVEPAGGEAAALEISSRSRTGRDRPGRFDGAERRDYWR